MADELFGIPTGLRAYQEDKIKLADLALRQQQGDTQKRLAEAQILNFETDNARQAEELRMKQQAAADEAAMRRRLAEIAQSSAGGSPETAGKPVLGGGSQADALLATGRKQVQALMAEGRVKEAGDLLAKLTNGEKDLAQARQAVSAAKENDWDVASKRHEFVARVMSGARDQPSYDAARIQLEASGQMTPEDMQKMPRAYSPRFVNSVVAGSTALKQKADMERDAARTAAETANNYDQIKNRALARALEERRVVVAEQRLAMQEKNGEYSAAAKDKPLPPATVRELEMVRGRLKRLGVRTDVASKQDLVADIAEQVKMLVDGTRMSRPEATARVVNEMKERGELEINSWSADKYQPKEGSITMPLPMPSQLTSPPLPTPKTREELEVGKSYVDAKDGRVKRFTGDGFEEVAAPKKGYYYADPRDGLVKKFTGKGFETVTGRKRRVETVGDE